MTFPCVLGTSRPSHWGFMGASSWASRSAGAVNPSERAWGTGKGCRWIFYGFSSHLVMTYNFKVTAGAQLSQLQQCRGESWPHLWTRSLSTTQASDSMEHRGSDFKLQLISDQNHPSAWWISCDGKLSGNPNSCSFVWMELAAVPLCNCLICQDGHHKHWANTSCDPDSGAG